MSVWLSLMLLPFIAALHRYACNMGYRYMSRRLAFNDACRVGLAMGLVVGGLLLVSCSSDASRGHDCAHQPDEIGCPGRRS